MPLEMFCDRCSAPMSNKPMATNLTVVNYEGDEKFSAQFTLRISSCTSTGKIAYLCPACILEIVTANLSPASA